MSAKAHAVTSASCSPLQTWFTMTDALSMNSCSTLGHLLAVTVVTVSVASRRALQLTCGNMFRAPHLLNMHPIIAPSSQCE